MMCVPMARISVLFGGNTNPAMRKLGIKCAKEEEMEMLRKGRRGKDGKSCSGNYSDACIGCGLYKG